MKDLFGDEREAAEKGWVSLHMNFCDSSELAVKLSRPFGGNAEWVPRSLVRWTDTLRGPHDHWPSILIDIDVREWAARERGWI